MKRKLDDLHDAFLQKPPTRKEELESERAWLEAKKRVVRIKADMLSAVARQREIAREKKEHAEKSAKLIAEMTAELEAMKRRHAATCSALEKQENLFVGQASKAYQSVLSLAERSKQAKSDLDQASERLVCTHGLGPIKLGTKMYDFGCQGERVYLVPRARQSLPKKGK